MKRKLLRQIANEWRTNIWLAVELLIVSAVMWWLTDQLWVKYSIYHEPLGFDTEHCYRLTVSLLNEKSPDYHQYDNDDQYFAEQAELIRRLETRPEIEAVGQGVNSYFYNHSDSWQPLSIDTLSGYYHKRWVTPGFIRVFRMEGANGETPDEMARTLENMPWNSFMADANMLRYKYGVQSMLPYVGKDFHSGNDSILWKLTKVFKTLRFSDYRTAYNVPSVIMPLVGKSIYYANETVVRVRENMDKDFAEKLMKDAVGNLRVGNWYIAAVDSFDTIRDQYNLSSEQDMRKTVLWSLFLLLNIFLGVLGTFWFRTSLRTPEIALRMANGATRTDIFRRIVSEGEIILLAVTPISIAICAAVAHYELNTYYWGAYFDWTRFIGCTVITWALIALMILVGSCLPARKAMSVSPAEALKTE